MHRLLSANKIKTLGRVTAVPLAARDMGRELLAETRSEPTYTDVGNADIAYVHP